MWLWVWLHGCGLSGLNLEYLIRCARVGQVAASTRGVCKLQPTSPGATNHMAIVASILSGKAALGQREVYQLAAHLHDCSGQVSAELKATLQAAHVLVNEQQIRVIAESGLVFWLVDFFDDLARVEEPADMDGVSLSDVMEVLIQATSLLLITQARGVVLSWQCYLLLSNVIGCRVLGVKGESGISSSTMHSVFSAWPHPSQSVTCQGKTSFPILERSCMYV